MYTYAGNVSYDNLDDNQLSETLKHSQLGHRPPPPTDTDLTLSSVPNHPTPLLPPAPSAPPLYTHDMLVTENMTMQKRLLELQQRIQAFEASNTTNTNYNTNKNNYNDNSNNDVSGTYSTFTGINSTGTGVNISYPFSYQEGQNYEG